MYLCPSITIDIVTSVILYYALYAVPGVRTVLFAGIFAVVTIIMLPLLLRLVKRVVEAGHHAGIEVAMCGGMAGEPLYTMVLLGLELDELSMNSLVIPRVKKIIRAVNMKECRALLKKVLTMSTASEIEYYVRNYMNKKFPDDFAEETQ